MQNASARPNQSEPKKKRKRRPKPQYRSRDLTVAASGVPARHHGGQNIRQPEPQTPALAERQERHFELHLSGASISAIARQTGHSRDTIAMDIRMECERRAKEMAEERQIRITSSIARCEAVIMRALIRGQAARAAGMEDVEVRDADGNVRREVRVKSPKTVALANNADKLVLQAQKQIDAICGLTVPLKGADAPLAGTVNETNIVMLMLDGLPDGLRHAKMQELKDRARAAGALPVQR